jgi:hypothetical protein
MCDTLKSDSACKSDKQIRYDDPVLKSYPSSTSADIPQLVRCCTLMVKDQGSYAMLTSHCGHFDASYMATDYRGKAVT